jgi:membrane protein
MAPSGKRINDFLRSKLWERDTASLGRGKALEITALRVLHLIVSGVRDEQLALRAMSLVYITLLSLVPLLAVSFSVLKAFGVHARAEIFLYYLLEPMGTRGVDLSMKIIEFVENVKIGVLGSLGLVILIYTVVSTVQKVERSLNYIWHVKGTRTLTQRLSNYLSVLLVGPVLIFSAVGLTASLMSGAVLGRLARHELVGPLIGLGGKLLPYVLICAAFTLIYLFLPNTKVRVKSALVGGVVAGILLQTAGWAFTAFIVGSAKYSAIYSGFATVVLLLIWLYWTCLVLFVGARVAFYHQHPHFLPLGSEAPTLSHRQMEELALAVMVLIAHSFLHDGRPWKLDSLAAFLWLPVVAVQDLLGALEEAGLVVASRDEPPAYFPARDTGAISLKEVIDAARSSGGGRGPAHARLPRIPLVEAVMGRIEGALSEALRKETLRGLVAQCGKEIALCEGQGPQGPSALEKAGAAPGASGG